MVLKCQCRLRYPHIKRLNKIKLCNILLVPPFPVFFGRCPLDPLIPKDADDLPQRGGVVWRPEERVRPGHEGERHHPHRPHVHRRRLPLVLEQDLGRPEAGCAGAGGLLGAAGAVAPAAVTRLGEAVASPEEEGEEALKGDFKAVDFVCFLTCKY